MSKTRKTWLTAGLSALLALLGILAFEQLRPRDVTELPPIVERSIFPVGTATPGGHRPGIVLVRNQYYMGGVTLTPAAGVVGSHIDIGWNDIQPNLTATPDWRPVETQVAYAAANGYQAWLSLQYFQNNFGGLDIITAPSGFPTVYYKVYDFQALTPVAGTPTRTPVATEVAPNYGSATFRNAYATAVASMLTKFGSDARVGGFALQLGASGETMNVQEDQRAYKKYWFEQVVSCDAFTNFVLDAAGWYRAGTQKPLTLALGIDACWQSSFNRDRKSNKYFLEKLNGANGATPTSTPLYIAYRHNGGNPDSAAAMYGTPTPGPWGRYQPGHALDGQGGIGFEPGSPYGFPTQVPTPDREGYADYMLLNLAAANADWIFLQKEWLAVVDPRVLDVVTQTLGLDAANSPLAWVWFRGAEFGASVDGGGYTFSGYPDPFTHLVRVTGSATPTTYCSPAVRATAQAYGGSAPPAACAQELSSPAARESRNALGYAAGSVVGLDIADDWQYAGDAANRDYTAELRYLDNNTGTITVRWKFASGVGSERTISKTGSGTWRTESWPLTAALNDGYGGHDVEIVVSDAQAILNSLVLSYAGPSAWEDATPTPTQTPTPGATPTPSRTPRPTATFVTATVTRTPTATPDWPALLCPEITPDLDGSLAEWSSVTPVALNSVTAALIQPATPAVAATPTGTPQPQAADASALLYCGRSVNTLYFAGKVLDDTFVAGQTYRAFGSLAIGDAVRITLDGARDGLSIPAGADDHDVFVAPNGRALDFDTYPLDAQVVIGATPGGWTFELALDRSALNISDLAGARFGLTWHLQDADSATGLEFVLDDRKRMGSVP